MTLWGYARVSTGDQDEALQVDALVSVGVPRDRVRVEHASGARTDRPVLAEVLAQVTEGDVLVVWKLDRLGRSLSHLVQTMDDLHARGVQFRSLTEGMDTTTAAGRLVFQVVAAMAEFERELVRERTRAGLDAARRSGKTLGRKTTVATDQVAWILAMHQGGVSQSSIARSTGLSRSQVGRVVRGEIASLADAPRTNDDVLRLYGREAQE